MKRVLFMAVCAAWLGFSCTSSKIEVDELRVELRENPVGVGTDHPRFMWQIESEKPDVMQEAYRIQVAASKDDLEKGKTCCGILVLWIRIPHCLLPITVASCNRQRSIFGVFG